MKKAANLIVQLSLKGKKKMKCNWRRNLIGLLFVAVLVLAGVICPQSVKAAQNVSVHDPSIVKDGDTYYVFGSHMAWAKSTDLQNWENFEMNINWNYSSLYGTVWDNWCKYNSSGVANKDNSGNTIYLKDNLWAPDVIWNETMQKWCMYMSNNGPDYNSVITLATADNIEGPYTYVGEVVYSGFTNKSGVAGHNVGFTDYKKVTGESTVAARYLTGGNWYYKYGTNAIDPCVKYDENGDLWMTYGSWFGGIYALKLDASTGLRDYSYTYETVTNKSDVYLGLKIAGGNGVSGEASYVVKNGDYWYLFVSYGGLTSAGGYNIRVFRSKSLTGPYVDQEGNSAIYTSYTNNINGTIGYRIFGNYKWSTMSYAEIAQGHNSAFVDDDGKMYIVYHTRFNNNTEGHEVRVHQLYISEDGWPVAAVATNSGETISESGYSKSDMVGTYRILYQKLDVDYANKKYASEQTICLQADGTITGAYYGTWSYKEGTAYVTLRIAGADYKGVFAKAAMTEGASQVMTFTASGYNMTVWGRKTSDTTSTTSVISNGAKLVSSYSFNGKAGNAVTVGSTISKAAKSSSITYTTGINGKAVSFSGSGSDGICIGKMPVSGSYSISFWFKATSSSAYSSMLYLANSTASNATQWISIGTQGSKSKLADGPMVRGRNSTYYNLSSDLRGSISLNEWRHFVLTVNNGTACMYIDGNKVGSGTLPTFVNGNTYLYLGVNGSYTPFKGAIDELSIYQGVLSLSEIRNMAAGNVTVKDYNNKLYPITTTKVTTKNTTATIKATGITTKVSGYLGKTITLKKGKKITIKATVKPAKAAQGVIYSTSAPSVASVSAKGVVKAKKAGTAYITITSKDGAKSVKYKIKVVKKNKTAKTFTLKSKSVTVKVGKMATLGLKKITAGATSTFTYKSLNKKKVTVDSYGVIKGIATGKTRVLVKCGKKKVYVTVKVTK